MTQSSISMSVAAVGVAGVFSVPDYFNFQFPLSSNREDYSNVRVEYRERPYRTNYDPELIATGYSDEERVALLVKFSESFSKRDISLTYEESKLISDNLFELI